MLLKISPLLGLRALILFSLVPYTLFAAQENKKGDPAFMPFPKKEQRAPQKEPQQTKKPEVIKKRAPLSKSPVAKAPPPSKTVQNESPPSTNNSQPAPVKSAAPRAAPSFYSLFSCEKVPNRSWLSAQHRESKGIGYNVGYSTLELFLGNPFCARTLGFLDLRGHIFNNGKWAANGGIGLRHGLESSPYVVGINAYYDYREASHAHFNQVGGGLELLANRWDLRLNGYVPIGKRKHKFEDGFSAFKGNRAIFAKQYEFSYYGGDLDLGCEFIKGDLGDLHGTLGGYYFYGEYGKNAGGCFLKLNARVTPYVSLEAQGSYDNLFRWIAQGAVALNVPFGGKALKKKPMSCMEPLSLGERLVEPVARFEIIVKNEHKKKALAVDPVTGEPLFFVFVDNELGSSDGTFEHPYPTLAEAETNSSIGDVLYVFSGDGTTTGMNAGITLKDNQNFLGSGVIHTFSTRFGMQDIPAQTNNLPSITRTGGNTVTLADNNVVRGFSIAGTAAGIAGSAIQNGTYADNTISTAGGGILIFSTSNGSFTIRSNTLTSYATGSGISFTTSSSTPTTLLIDHNHLTGTVTATAIFVESNTASRLTTTINSNTILDSRRGINILPIDTSNTTVLIDGNTISNMTQYGIEIDPGNNAITDARIYRNTISTTGLGGVIVAPLADSFMTVDMQQNTITNADSSSLTGSAVRFATKQQTSVDVRLFENSAFSSGNAEIGYAFTNGAGAFLRVQSPDLALSGVAQLNDGSNVGANSATKIGAISTTGTITYTDLFLFPQSP